MKTHSQYATERKYILVRHENRREAGLAALNSIIKEATEYSADNAVLEQLSFEINDLVLRGYLTKKATIEALLYVDDLRYDCKHKGGEER